MSRTALPQGAQARALLAALPSPLGVLELLEPLALPVYRGRMVTSGEVVAVKVGATAGAGLVAAAHTLACLLQVLEYSPAKDEEVEEIATEITVRRITS